MAKYTFLTEALSNDSVTLSEMLAADMSISTYTLAFGSDVATEAAKIDTILNHNLSKIECKQVKICGTAPQRLRNIMYVNYVAIPKELVKTVLAVFDANNITYHKAPWNFAGCDKTSDKYYCKMK